MKRILALIFVVGFTLTFALSNTQSVFSGDLGALVRLDKQTPSQSTGGTICATPETNDTEASLQVIFPTGMTVNSAASNWTVDTDNLPDNSTPMPGINTATSVSGQTVTFPISNLSTGTTYCFNFSASNTLTTSSTNGTFTGTLRTRDNTNTTIDTRGFAIHIITNNTIQVTAQVGARPTDFNANLTLTDPTTARIPENTTLQYSLTYGSNLPYVADIVVEAEWEEGTIRDSGATGTEEVVSYINGSATDAYNNTPPVIDVVNRKITWTISNFPANTNRNVTFNLRTYDGYQGSQPVDFKVKARVLGFQSQTADSTVNSTYQYSRFITPTPDPTCIPSKCPTPRPSATPTPTPVPRQTIIESVIIRSITSNTAAIEVITNNNTSIKISYGTTINSLSKQITLPVFSKTHLITLSELQPQTRYYFTLRASDEHKRIVDSDLYLLDTAALSTPPQALPDSIIITSDDVVLTDPLRKRESIPKIVIPQSTPYAFKFAVRDFENIKSIRATMYDEHVLGLTSFVAYASNEALNITEISPGQYIGRLTTTPSEGVYRLLLRISDFSGNIVEQTASTIFVVHPLQVLNASTHQGIENAKVTTYYYNSRTRTYSLLSSSITPIKNPDYTSPSGSSAIVLPEGKYRAEIEAIGYKSKTVDFEITPGSQENYPHILLTPLPFSIVTYLRYSAQTAMDVISLLQNYIHTLRSSIRFFDFMAFSGIGILVLLTAVSASRRFSIPFLFFPSFLLYQFLRIFNHTTTNVLIHGKVTIKGSDIVVPFASVYFGIPNRPITNHAFTNTDGEFITYIKKETDLRVTISKKGFTPIVIVLKKGDHKEKLFFDLVPITKPKGVTLQNIFWYSNFITGALFESLLLLTIFVELLFVLEFGWLKVLPFLTVSILNLALWAFHAKHTRSI